MEKVCRVTKMGDDSADIEYWASLSESERLTNLEHLRQEVNRRLYGDSTGFQRVYKVVKRKQRQVPRRGRVRG
jgi:hypothetical protein